MALPGAPFTVRGVPRLAPAAFVAALALSASACGADAVPEEDVAAAGKATRAAGTARIETFNRFEFAGQVRESRTTAVVDYVGDRSETVDEQSGCRTVLIGSASYTELPVRDGLPPGKRWVRFEASTKSSEEMFEESLEASRDRSESGWEGYAEIHRFSFGAAPAPDDYLDYLTELSGELEAVGEEEVRGVATTHYRTTIDARHKTRHDLEADGWKPGNIERYLENVEATTEEVDVWVDAESRVRRVVTTAAYGRGMSQVTTTTEYYDFGRDVEIEPPPGDAVLGEDEWKRVAEASESDVPPSCLH
jgi:hypothetical protein